MAFTHAVGGDPTTGEIPQVVVDWLATQLDVPELPATATTGDVLTWDGSAWVADIPTSGTQIEPTTTPGVLKIGANQ